MGDTTDIHCTYRMSTKVPVCANSSEELDFHFDLNPALVAIVANSSGQTKFLILDGGDGVEA